MKKGLQKTLVFALPFISLTTLIVGTLAWFRSIIKINSINGGGAVDSAYYAYGKGTKDEPFGIANTRHLNNLAWLQYLGVYDNDNYYFELANDINVGESTYVIPPIGNEDHPFIGVFNGNDHVIENIKVTNTSNVAEFTYKSSNITDYNSNDFEIVGFFGVVGELEGESYSSQVNTIKDVTFKNLTVESKTENTLIGLAAGYVNADISNVKIDGTATINVNDQVHTAKTNITDKLSDYGLVGYTTKVGSNGSYSTDLSEYFNSGDGTGGGGQEQDWGGSIVSTDYFKWLHQSGNIATQTGVTVTGTGYKGYYNRASNASEMPDDDSMLFRNSSTRYFRLYSDGTFYFKYNASTNYTGNYENNPSAPNIIGYKLMFDNEITLGTGTSSVTSNTFYLNKQNSGANFVVTSTMNSTTTINGFSSTFTIRSSWIYQFRESSYLPLRFENENWISNGTNNTVSSKNTGYILGNQGTAGSNASVRLAYYCRSNLINSISPSHTDSLINIYNGHFLDEQFNEDRIEILTYDKNEDDWVLIKDDWNGSYDADNPALATYADTKTDDSSPKSLGFTKYDNSRNILSNEVLSTMFLGGIHFDPTANNYGIGQGNNLETYSNCKVLSDTASSYQMPRGTIDFKLKSTGAINFFAGTYYSSDVNFTFFSIYDVVRKTDGTINTLKEITKIFTAKTTAVAGGTFDTSKPSDSKTNTKYIYQYIDGSYSQIYDPSPSVKALRNATAADIDNNNLVFDCTSSLKAQAPVKNALYYFELPVNDGEFAMSSVSGSTLSGAYLLYLDIGANADIIDSDEITAYSITTKRSGNQYPQGVDFIATDVAGNGGESVGVYISNSKQGQLVFVVTSKNIAITDNSDISTFTFEGTDYTDAASPPDGKFNITSGTSPGPMESPPVGGERVLFINIKKVNSTTVYGVKITDYLDSSGNIDESESKYEIDYDDGMGFIAGKTKAEVETLSTSLDIAELRSLNIAATLTRIPGYDAEFSVTYNVADCSYSEKTIDIDIATNGVSLTIIVNTDEGYTLKVNGSTPVSPYPGT